MKLFYTILIVCFARVAVAQTFQAAPGPVHVQQMALLEANECLLRFTNPSGDSLRLRWRLLEKSAPESWKFDICDYGACYANFPSSGWMNYVYDTIRPYLKLIVQPGQTPGDAWLRYRVFEADHSDNFQDVYFSLFTPGITAVTAPGISALRVFPNPANDFLVVENPSEAEQIFQLFNHLGQQVQQQSIAPRSREQYPVQGLHNGLYYLHSPNRTFTLLIQH
jgi:hypothetical protein